jgi:hypothetical protein
MVTPLEKLLTWEFFDETTLPIYSCGLLTNYVRLDGGTGTD